MSNFCFYEQGNKNFTVLSTPDLKEKSEILINVKFDEALEFDTRSCHIGFSVCVSWQR